MPTNLELRQRQVASLRVIRMLSHSPIHHLLPLVSSASVADPSQLNDRSIRSKEVCKKKFCNGAKDATDVQRNRKTRGGAMEGMVSSR